MLHVLLCQHVSGQTVIIRFSHKRKSTNKHTHRYANTTQFASCLATLVALLTRSAPYVNMRLRSLKLNTRHSKWFQFPQRLQADTCRRAARPAHRPLRPWRFGCNTNLAFGWIMTPKEKLKCKHFYPIESVAMTRGIHVKHLPAKIRTVIWSRLRRLWYASGGVQMDFTVLGSYMKEKKKIAPGAFILEI